MNKNTGLLNKDLVAKNIVQYAFFLIRIRGLAELKMSTLSLHHSWPSATLDKPKINSTSAEKTHLSTQNKKTMSFQFYMANLLY